MESTNQSLLNGIDTVIMRVSNLGKSSRWYSEKPKLQPVYEDEASGIVVFETGSPTSLTLWQTDEIITICDNSSFPIFSVADAKNAQTEFSAIGIRTDELQVSDNLVSFFFYDPDGNRMEACQVL